MEKKTVIIVKTKVRAEMRETLGVFTNKLEAIKFLWERVVPERDRTRWEYPINLSSWWGQIKREHAFYGVPWIFEEYEVIGK